MKRRVMLLLLLVIGVSTGASLAPAVAQQYPPPPTTGSCPDLVVRGEIGDGFQVGRAESQGDIRVEAGEGSAGPGEVVVIRVDEDELGTTTAHEDGSFVDTFTLPASVEPGLHQVVAETERCGNLSHPLEVIGASVLGTTDTRSTGGGAAGGGSTDSGLLPRTGMDLLLFVLWALALIALGTMLATTAWRWRRRLALAGRPHATPAVPYVDTSRFVPRYTKTRRSDRR